MVLGALCSILLCIKYSKTSSHTAHQHKQRYVQQCVRLMSCVIRCVLVPFGMSSCNAVYFIERRVGFLMLSCVPSEAQTRSFNRVLDSRLQTPHSLTHSLSVTCLCVSGHDPCGSRESDSHAAHKRRFGGGANLYVAGLAQGGWLL